MRMQWWPEEVKKPDPPHGRGFNAMKALSTRNSDPLKASRPFERDRDGFVVAEGSGIVVLEELEHAKSGGQNIC